MAFGYPTISGQNNITQQRRAVDMIYQRGATYDVTLTGSTYEDSMELEEVVMLEDTEENYLDEVVAIGYGTEKDENSNDVKENFNNIKVRTNLQETAFFFPQLQTDKEGNVSFSFTTPEALTRWKLQLIAHTKNLKSATKTLQTVTQKELMVMPNAPRFLREGDQITISSKIANLSDKALSGSAILLLYDALTNKGIDVNLGNAANNKTFYVDAKGYVYARSK